MIKICQGVLLLKDELPVLVAKNVGKQETCSTPTTLLDAMLDNKHRLCILKQHKLLANLSSHHRALLLHRTPLSPNQHVGSLALHVKAAKLLHANTSLQHASLHTCLQGNPPSLIVHVLTAIFGHLVCVLVATRLTVLQCSVDGYQVASVPNQFFP